MRAGLHHPARVVAPGGFPVAVAPRRPPREHPGGLACFGSAQAPHPCCPLSHQPSALIVTSGRTAVPPGTALLPALCCVMWALLRAYPCGKELQIRICKQEVGLFCLVSHFETISTHLSHLRGLCLEMYPREMSCLPHQ